MVLGIFAMKDALNGFMNIFPEQSSDMAKRGFLHGLACAEPSSLFYTHPQDYSLYRLGDFDTESGRIDVYLTPEFIVGGEKHNG
ncbi:nonstructural protein [Microvirus mar20]|uniref:Nonstructural protein n=1 Tax=Microvirus mar20 TaxID=2851153 RepID=A0A8F5MKI5_9VIRU|nr:nonstructural protein [Microvirus mar20]